MINLDTLTMSSTIIPPTATTFIAQLLIQADGPRRHESRVRAAIVHAVIAARTAPFGDGVLFDTVADEERVRQWVLLQLGDRRDIPRPLMSDVAGMLHCAAFLLQLESDYQPGGCGGFEITSRTHACAFASRRAQRAGDAWTSSIAEAAQRLAAEASQYDGDRPSDHDRAVWLNSYLAELDTPRLKWVLADERESEAAKAFNLAHAESPQGIERVSDHPAAVALREAAECKPDRPPHWECVDVTATAALQWLRGRASAAATAAELAAALEQLAILVIHVADTSRRASVLSGGDGERRLQRQAARLEHCLSASP